PARPRGGPPPRIPGSGRGPPDSNQRPARRPAIHASAASPSPAARASHRDGRPRRNPSGLEAAPPAATPSAIAAVAQPAISLTRGGMGADSRPGSRTVFDFEGQKPDSDSGE